LSHPVTGIREAIEAVGAVLKPWPTDSPDFTPIEQVFAKLKALLRKVGGERTLEAL
jgi:transposase